MQYTKGIYDLLTGSSSVTNRVSTKIFPIVAPSGTALPFITYEHVSATVFHTKEGTAYEQARVEVVVYAISYNDALGIGKVVRDLLDGQSVSSTSPIRYTIDRLYFMDEQVERLEDPDRFAYVIEFEAFVLL